MINPTYEEVVELKNSGEKNFYVVLGKKYNKSPDAIRSSFRRESARRVADSFMDFMVNDEEIQETTQEEVDIHGDNDEEKEFKIPEYRASTKTVYDDDNNLKYISSDRLILMHEKEEKNPEFVLRAHGFDPNEWVIKDVLNNYWQGMRPEDLGGATLYQSKLTVKPKKESNTVSIEDIELYFSKKTSDATSTSVNPDFIKKFYGSNRIDTFGKKLIVPIADLHFGNGNIQETMERLEYVKMEIINKLQFVEVDEIVVVAMGDILHVDTDEGTTTSGTKVGSRGMIFDIWTNATDAMISFVSSLADIAPLRYIHVSGNHDKVNSFTLSKSVQYNFKDFTNITFDNKFEEVKYFRYGNSIIAFTHGDIGEKKTHTIIQKGARKEYGETKYAYVIMGHLHHIQAKDADGVIVMTLPSTTKPDEWHRSKGFIGSWRGTNVFLYDEELGLSEVWHLNAER